MKDYYSPKYREHTAQTVTTLATCWRIVKTNGELVLGTDHDVDIPITVTNIGIETGSPPFDLTGVYLAKSGIMVSDIKASEDMSVDNLEVDGAVKRPDLYAELSVEDIRAGLFNGAVVTVFKVNWQDPDDFQEILRHGFSGQIDWDSDGNYKAEVRGLMQILQQSIGSTASEDCDVAELGDSRCKLNVAALTVTGTITAVTSRRRFTAALDLESPPPDSGYFNLGKLTMTSGLNAGYVRQVKNDSVESVLGAIDLWEAFPRDLQIGDTFTLEPGCDRKYPTCKKFGNLVNFRGVANFVPGMDEIIRAP